MDLADEIIAIKIEQGKHTERLDDLEEYQKRQNGSLQRVESKEGYAQQLMATT